MLKLIGVVNGVKHAVVYVPLLRDLQSVLAKEDVFDFVFHQPILPSGEGIYADYVDGELFRSHSLFSSDPTALRLFLFSDAFQACNPLGIYRKNKIDAIYYCIGNLERKHRSSMQNIRLAILVKTDTIKNFGIHSVLKPLIEDIKVFR